MGSITFNNLKNTNISQKRHTYVDMTLDFGQEPFEMRIGNNVSNGSGKDIKTSQDLNAIKNSIVNLLNTTPGERLLMPDFGCSLRNFIFDPISETTSRLIGRTIKTSLEQWEPRVTIININIDSYESRQEYEITLVLQVPFLSEGQTLNITGLLNKQGFRI